MPKTIDTSPSIEYRIVNLPGKPTPHPGVYLKEIMDEMGLSIRDITLVTALFYEHIQLLLECKIPFSAKDAVELGRCFGQSPAFWISLQRLYDKTNP